MARIESLESRTLFSSQSYDWENVTMGGAGFVTGIITNPSAADVMYARTDIGGAYRWDAVNQEWDPMLDWATSADWTLYGVESLASDPVETNRVYVAAGTYTNSWSGNGAILRSTDQGRTWLRTNVPFKFGGNEDGRSNGERLVVDPNKNNILFLGTRDNGLWKSSDYGATWNQVTTFPVTTTTNGVGLNLVEFIKSTGTTGNATQTIYVGVADPSGSLYKSTDGGATWAAVANMPAGKFPHHAAQDGLGNMYLTYNDAPGPNGVATGIVAKLKLSDDTWTNVTPTSLSGGSGIAGVSVDKQNPTTLIVSTMDKWYRRDDVYRSRNGGSTWVDLRGQNATDKAVTDGGVWNGQVGIHWTADIEIDPFNSNKAWVVTGFGVWSIDDLTAADSGQPTHWRLNDKGLEEAVVQDIEAPPGPVEVYDVIFDYSGFRHTDVDEYPTGPMLPRLGSSYSIDFARLNSNYVVRIGGGAPYGTYSTDGGVTWTGFASTPTGTGGGKIAMSADGSRLVWNIGSAMYYSTNNGTTWTASTTALNLVPVADAVNPLKFYAYDAAAGVVWISTNGGVSFASGGTVPTGGGNIETALGIEGDIWLAQSGGLYHSTNSGATFTKISSTTAASRVTLGKAAPGQSYPAIYLRGTANGLSGMHRSDDGGATWVQIDDPQHQFGGINDIQGDPDVYGRVYLASQHRGVIFGDIGGPVIADPPVVVLDNSDATGVAITGAWSISSSTSGYYGTNYIQDGNTGKGTKSVRFTPTITQTDTYEVYARWTAATNRATNTPIDINYASGSTTVTVNQQTNGATWVLLGTFSFNAGTSGNVLIRTTGTNGYVVADAVKFVQVGASTPPTVVTNGSASPSVVNLSMTSTLSVLGNDYLGESYLTYSWFADGPNRVTYSNNFTNSAKTTTITFKKVGTYVLTCTIRDPRGLSTTSSVTVIVNNTSSISGKAYEDRNGNNLMDAGEPPLSGATIYIDANNNNLFDPGESSVITSGTGSYILSGLAAGNYKVRSVSPAGYISTSSTATITLPTNTNINGTNFGNFPITFTGTTGNDNYSLRSSGSSFTIWMNGVLTYSIAQSLIGGLSFNGAGGSDTFYIQGTGALDLMTLASTGSIARNGKTFSYSGFEKLQLQLGNYSISTNLGPIALELDNSIAQMIQTQTLSSMSLTNHSTLTSASTNSLAPAMNITGGVTIDNSTLAIAANGGLSGVTQIGSLNLTNSARLELHNNDLIINYGNSLSPYNQIIGAVRNGLALLGGTGTFGITSSEVDSQAIQGTILAVLDDGDSMIDGAVTQTSGFNLTNPAQSIIVKYTWFGDCNQDGAVDGSDYALLDSGFTSSGALSGWVFGDLDFSIQIDGSDYALIDTGFISQDRLL